MNLLSPEWIKFIEATGAEWTTAKFRFYAVDLDKAGPTAGAWRITSVTNSNTTTPTINTSAAHGFSVGEYVSISRLIATVSQWAASTALAVNAYRTPTTGNSAYTAGKKYRCLKAGTTGAIEPVWTTADYSYIFDNVGSILWVCEGNRADSIMNGMWQIATVPTSTSFTISLPFAPGYTTAPGTLSAWAVPISRTYLSQLAVSTSRIAMSNPLSAKAIVNGQALDAADPTVNITTADTIDMLVLARAAALNADADLADTAQRVVATYDTAGGLPLAANAGVTQLQIPQNLNRLIRF